MFIKMRKHTINFFLNKDIQTELIFLLLLENSTSNEKSRMILNGGKWAKSKNQMNVQEMK